jgi:hypothetical protein
MVPQGLVVLFPFVPGGDFLSALLVDFLVRFRDLALGDLIMWGQRLICHHECSTLMLYLVEGHKFVFVAKTFHVPKMNLKMKCKLIGKCALMSYVLN